VKRRPSVWTDIFRKKPDSTPAPDPDPAPDPNPNPAFAFAPGPVPPDAHSSAAFAAGLAKLPPYEPITVAEALKLHPGATNDNIRELLPGITDQEINDLRKQAQSGG
jgi:hypothetical protein